MQKGQNRDESEKQAAVVADTIVNVHNLVPLKETSFQIEHGRIHNCVMRGHGDVVHHKLLLATHAVCQKYLADFVRACTHQTEGGGFGTGAEPGRGGSAAASPPVSSQSSSSLSNPIIGSAALALVDAQPVYVLETFAAIWKQFYDITKTAVVSFCLSLDSTSLASRPTMLMTSLAIFSGAVVQPLSETLKRAFVAMLDAERSQGVRVSGSTLATLCAALTALDSARTAAVAKCVPATVAAGAHHSSTASSNVFVLAAGDPRLYATFSSMARLPQLMSTVIVQPVFTDAQRYFSTLADETIASSKSGPAYIGRFLVELSAEQRRITSYVQPALVSRVTDMLCEVFLTSRREAVLTAATTTSTDTSTAGMPASSVTAPSPTLSAVPTNAGAAAGYLADSLKHWCMADIFAAHFCWCLAGDAQVVVEAACDYVRSELQSIFDHAALLATPVPFTERLVAIKDRCRELLQESFCEDIHRWVHECRTTGKWTELIAQGKRPTSTAAAARMTSSAASSAGGGTAGGGGAAAGSSSQCSGFTSASANADAAALSRINATFDNFVNKNPSFMAETIAAYFDAKLKGPGGEETDIDAAAEHCVDLISRLRDRDMFESAHKNYLAKRIIGGKINEEHERLLIARLKRQYGHSMTSKMEGMFADRRQSEELLDQYREKSTQRGEKLPLDLHLMVLTAGFWPTWVTVSFCLPMDIRRAADHFAAFYKAKFRGRRLDYALSQSSVDVKVHVAGGARKYDVNVPTVCMAVLNLFHGDEAKTVAEVATACALVAPEAARAAMSLLRVTPNYSNLLMIKGVGSDGQPTAATSATPTPLTPSTLLAFNGDFRSKTIKVRIVPVVVKEGGGGRGSAGAADAAGKERLDEDRKYKIDAAIVRIMKSRRTLDHRTLVATVLQVLSALFQPSPEDVKKRIEHLIDREFLQRSEEMPGTYNYLA